MRLGVRIGQGCAVLHDSMMRDLQIPILEFDEVWGYVGKKQRQTLPHETDKGDQYTFIALDATGKGIVSYVTGKRTEANTRAFVNDVWERIINKPQITTDGFGPYIEAVAECFGDGADFAQLVKHYAAENTVNAARRYSPPHVVRVEKMVVSGRPARRHVSTSYVERQNLTLRMQQRRFTRLTNGFSKKLENHRAAVSLYVAHYNLCRIHEATKITPTMHLGVTDHIWEIGELIEAATGGWEPPPRFARFEVIAGGKG
jgi:IS1 family transposase